LQIPPGTTNGEVDLNICEEDLKIAVGKCDPRKTVGVEGIPGGITRIIVEQRTRVLLDVLNEINNVGRIPAVWKVARVVLISKPAKGLSMSSSYRPISILPALSKV
jgi:hypothetical protein